MNKFMKRDIATSLTAFLFLVIGVTGIFMYFHILDNYTKNLHENLGLVFILVIFFHVFYNWKAMKSYFSKKIFLYSGLLVSSVALVFILTSETGENPKMVLMKSVLNSPLENSLIILNKNPEIGKDKLKKAGLKLDNANSISELAKLNKTSPFKIVSILIEK